VLAITLLTLGENHVQVGFVMLILSHE